MSSNQWCGVKPASAGPGRGGPATESPPVTRRTRPATPNPGPDTTFAVHAVFDAAPNAIVAVDSTARILYANPRADVVFGYRRGELIGQPVERLLPGRLATRHLGHRNEFMAHPVARPMGIGLDLAGRRKDGSEFPVEISLSPIETAAGMQVFATIVDITARKAAEHQLLQSQKLESVGRLAGGIAHDFSNMLFVIRGYAELLAEDLGLDDSGLIDREAAATSLAAISEAATRASTLTKQLLAFSRQQVVSPRVLDVNDAVRNLEPMLRRLIGEDIALVVTLDPAVGHLREDPGQLDQILVNLVVNARDAICDGGTITIATANIDFDEPFATQSFEIMPGAYVLLAVGDTGVGMDQATQEHIFEPFFTTKEVGKGTGLGLATIYGIVRQAGGHIWLYSEPRRGSTFKLYFPRVDEIVAVHAPVVLPDEPGGTGTVLIVEDEPAVREMLTQILGRSGYRVVAVADGAEALETAGSLAGSIDVLISDVVMPTLSGVELAERIAERRPGIGIILLSGYTPETLDLERAMARGARFLAKPIASNELRRTVRELMAVKRTAT